MAEGCADLWTGDLWTIRLTARGRAIAGHSVPGAATQLPAGATVSIGSAPKANRDKKKIRARYFMRQNLVTRTQYNNLGRAWAPPRYEFVSRCGPPLRAEAGGCRPRSPGRLPFRRAGPFWRE